MTMPWPGSMVRTVPVPEYIALRAAAKAAGAVVVLRERGNRGRKKAKQVAAGGYRRGAKGGWEGPRATVIGTVSDIKHFAEELLNMADDYGTNTAKARKYYKYKTANAAPAMDQESEDGGAGRSSGGRSRRASRAASPARPAAAGGGDGDGDDDDDDDDGLDPAASNRSDASDSDATSINDNDEAEPDGDEPEPANDEEADFDVSGDESSKEETTANESQEEDQDEQSDEQESDGGNAPAETSNSSSSSPWPRPPPVGSLERFLSACDYGICYFSNRAGGENAAFASAAGAKLHAMTRFGLPAPIELEDLPGALRKGSPPLKVVACQCSMARELYTHVCLPLVLMQMLPVRKVEMLTISLPLDSTPNPYPELDVEAPRPPPLLLTNHWAKNPTIHDHSTPT